MPDLILSAACRPMPPSCREQIELTPREIDQGKLIHCPTCNLPTFRIWDGVCELCYIEGAASDYDPDRDGYIWERDDLCH